VCDGVPVFVPSFPYCGEIEQESMAEVLRAAEVNWRDALLCSPDPKVTRVSEAILNLDRANWSLLTNVPSEGRVLDLGAGMGANSHALAKRHREVLAVEPVVEQARFMRERFKQENLPNVHVVQTSLWDLPFPDGSFDLVCMDGVLQCVAQGRAGDPRDVQLSALRRAARLLRSGGVLYVGIENRFAVRRFMGYPDPHSSLPWVTILPRPLAQRYAAHKGQAEGYRHYLYSAAGYRKLLRETGFAESEAFLALPSYDRPRFYVPLRDNVFSYFVRTFGASASWWGILQKVVGWLGATKHLEHSFALLATK
jgi:SAM-dependent methyltransferase